MGRASLYFTITGILQFISMAFLIICCVTAPVIRQIGLAKFEGITYGTFGYCSSEGVCSSASASYGPESLTSDTSAWKLNDAARGRLGKILIVMPIAAGFNFLALIVTIVSLALSVFHSNFESISAIMFIVNLIFDIIGFLTAALMCVVTFLLFFPKITWCSWLLIPAAALPLLTIPLIFIGFTSAKSSSSMDLESDDQMPLSGRVDRDIEFSDINDKNITPLVVPDFRPNRNIYTTNTSTTDFSSIEKEKEEFEFSARERSNTPDLSNGQTPYVDDSMKRESYSPIDDEDNTQKPGISKSVSLESSVYSRKDIEKGQNNSRILEDIMNDYNADGSNPSEDERKSVTSDSKLSDFTSVSQRGVNPNYYQQQQPLLNNNIQNNNIRSNNNNISNNNNLPMPYPHSNKSINYEHGQRTQQHFQPQMNLQQQQRQFHQPIQQSMQQPMQQRMAYQQPAAMMPQMQHQYNAHQQVATTQGPDVSDILIQANPDFAPVRQTHTHMPNNTGRFQSAYKKRMNNRANIYNNLHSTSAYGFR